MLNKNNCFIGCESEYKNASVVIFGAPFDGTTSYRPGTRFASRRMREESYGIETFSPYLNKDLSEIAVCDAGDLELSIGNTAKVLEEIESFAQAIIADGKIPLMIGGEHLVTLGSVRATAKKYANLNVLHFDAHADLRDAFLGEKLSHSTVIRRTHELVGDNKIFQFGIRSGEKEEFLFAKEHTIMNRFDLKEIDYALQVICDNPVYLTIDLDVLDPSEFPGTGTPEAGGVKFVELLEALKKVSKLNIVGCDINELSPPYDPSGISTALACKILRELLLIITK